MSSLASHTVEPALGRRPRDASGFEMFHDGDTGLVHVVAHRLLDRDEHDRGHQLLGAWLANHSVSGSEGVHLHWHMMVFELAVGKWHEAHQRFMHEIQPAALGNDAFTDVPAALWRLRLAAQRPVRLPWATARTSALRGLTCGNGPYVTLHHLLALAGAGDAASIVRWVELDSHERPLLTAMAEGLRRYAAGNYAKAAAFLTPASRQVSELGGSRAQNQLFAWIADDAARRADAMPLSRRAA